MFPLCSATSCRYHSQILFPGNWRGCSSFRRELIHRYSSGDNAFFGISNGTRLQKSFVPQATGSFLTGTIEKTEQPVSTFGSLCQNELDRINYMVYNMSEAFVASDEGLTYVENGEDVFPVEAVAADVSPVEAVVPDVSPIECLSAETLTDKTSSLIDSVESGTNATVKISPDSSVSLPDAKASFDDFSSGLKQSFSSSLPDAKASVDDFSSGVKESFSSSLNQGENAVKNTLESFSSSVTSITKNASEVVDSAVNRAFSTLDQTGDVAGDKFSSFSTGLKEASNRAAVIAIDLLRQSVSLGERSVTNGVSFVVYSYGSAKELLPPDVKSALNSSEDVALKVLSPVGAVLQQVSVAIGGLERNIGLDPDDPILHLFLFVGTTGTFWVLYRVWTYGGYAGDLSPKSTLDLLKSRDKSVLIDVRPEALREKDGIPDLRRSARFRYSSVTLPEVDGDVKRLLKGGSEVDDILTAVIIKNLKIVQDRSKVVVMDADGTRSKGIARALRKVGIKRPYLMQGGYRSWVQEGLRVKEPKPETTLTILNEEAEAIFEDINPSPLQLFGVGVGFFAALYALSEWEKTLQLIAVIGLSLTIYLRLSSYDDSEDFKQDVRLLLAPVKLGAQAFSWAAGKLETNGVGLPTSPSSSDVRSRVLQAAAKHESKPSDETSESLQDASSSPEEALNNVDVSEA
ncbi:Rhodanese/Cell cycle control phosphatase superfamily protein [Arabidopsis thaliana]|uniref:Rhodanese/Cell cycle control phosphatase superfamily protein n=1 Tax=Arabidopsis thaliana TaxID=3702 RepID=F4J9G2_ARATH|nr:Rhodanese/Cell cycle control phosphatase superfamily protein [Arabidopsis thaliana]AEE79968.1 Rhodanese/Cell cycle control phosphatase superfamily protein [Arabidopsis thaliana]|eukprot:NP_191537.4 Rhodanese/Cell cycle control phosphatase superfamily protein [Arabidopsis thaliana]